MKIVGRPGAGGRPEDDDVGRHVLKVHPTLKKGYQIVEYVTRLVLDECPILAAGPEGLGRLPAIGEECGVRPREPRSFEAVIRTWTACVFSDAEGG